MLSLPVIFLLPRRRMVPGYAAAGASDLRWACLHLKSCSRNGMILLTGFGVYYRDDAGPAFDYTWRHTRLALSLSYLVMKITERSYRAIPCVIIVWRRLYPEDCPIDLERANTGPSALRPAMHRLLSLPI